MKENNELLIKHFEFLQSLITRMAQNSFNIKGWCLTLVSAILGFLITESFSEVKYYLILLVPIIGFTILDTFYLRLERTFRNRYEEDVKKLGEGRIDEIKLLSFSSKEQSIKWYKVMFSSSILMTYVPVVLIVLLILLFMCR